jgi:type II secretory pathway pseudopilin PulG
MKSRTSRPGVTLVEMIVVLAILMMLAGLLAIVWNGLFVQTKEKALHNTLTILDNALTEYYDEQGAYLVQPISATQGANKVARRGLALRHSQTMMEALESEVASRQVVNMIDNRYLKNLYLPGSNDVIPEVYDPWDTPIDYVYVKGDTFPVLRSAGPDGDFGTSDDIVSR